MKKILFIFLEISLFIPIINAQSFQVLWEKSYGGSQTDFCSYSTLTADNCILAVGYTTSNDGDFHGNHGGYDIAVIKLNQDGDTVWTKLLGGTLNDKGFFVQATPDSGCIIAAATYSTYGQITINYGGFDDWIVKLNVNGNIQWQKTYGGSSDDYAKSIKLTSDNGYIVNGWTWSDNGFVHGSHGIWEDMWVLKLNAVGDTLWTKCLGGTGWDYGYDIAELSGGIYIAAGEVNSNDGDVIDNNNNYNDVSNTWLVKLDTSGNKLWSKCTGNNNYEHVPLSIIATHNDCYNCFVLLENKYTLNHSPALGIYKYGTNGDTIWSKNISTQNYPYSYPHFPSDSRVYQTLDTNIIILVSPNYFDTLNNMFIEKINLLTGDSIWSVNIGDTSCYPSAINEVEKNTFIVSGSKYINNLPNFYFLKFKIVNTGDYLEHLSTINFTVYPNPSLSGKFTIQLPMIHEQVYATVSDNYGKILFIDAIKQNQTQYHFHGKLPEGVYFLTLSNKNTLSSKKIIIQ